MTNLTFSTTQAHAMEIMVEGLQTRFEAELYKALRKQLDEIVANADKELREAAKKASQGYVASVRQYHGRDYSNPSVVLLFDRKEVPLDGA